MTTVNYMLKVRKIYAQRSVNVLNIFQNMFNVSTEYIIIMSNEII